MCSPWPPTVAWPVPVMPSVVPKIAASMSCTATALPASSAPTKPLLDEPRHVGARARVHQRRPRDPDRVAAALALLDEQARHQRVVDRLLARDLARHELELARRPGVARGRRRCARRCPRVPSSAVPDRDAIAARARGAPRAPRARRPRRARARSPCAARAAGATPRPPARRSAGWSSRRSPRAARRRRARRRTARPGRRRTAPGEKSGCWKLVTPRISPAPGGRSSAARERALASSSQR